MAFWFGKMQQAIKERLEKEQHGLYEVLIFPIAFACLLTFAGARIVSHYWPYIYLEPTPGLHIHHYAYGFCILAVAGYLALIFNGPRAKFLISLLFGFGLGLAFDEFAMWLRVKDDDPTRWDYDGMVIIISAFFLILTLEPGIRFIMKHMPFTKKDLVDEHIKYTPIINGESSTQNNKTS